MDEREWLTCEDPDRMLKYLGKKYNPRKLRLFAVACCRTAWYTLDNADRRAVEVAERYADGKASRRELDEAGDATSFETISFQTLQPVRETDWYNPAYWVTRWNAFKAAMDASAYAAGRAIDSKKKRVEWDAGFSAERARYCRLLREIVGNPFRSTCVRPEVLPWQGGTVIRMAQAIYDDRRFADMPILADALEDAGCDNPDILSHCRGVGEHVRGCWVVDLLLGKE